ncbi:MAG: ABC-F family ATP-binding cassette domain-containing protein, partial [Nitratireductor sp.]|nr:ABC-F family ATP-binding cassette domain-containing protein [Nitratireductor sp.]
MAAPILFLEDIHLNFGGAALLEGASLAVFEGDRLCLVGRNGSGKSTLLKIAAGSVEADSGERFVQPGVTMRYLPQEPDFSGFKTVLDYVEAGLAPADDHHRARYLLGELGLTGEENPAALSGGEARRAALARTLAPEPDILLLDEPTNHLDLPAIEWLEGELKRARSALVLISHDRRFLQSLSRRTLWIDRGETRLLDKGFGEFEEWRDTFLENEEAERHKANRKVVREEHWITHGVSGRRKRNMRRVHELAALRRDIANQKQVAGSVRLTTAEGEASGKLVAKLDHVSKSFGERAIVRDFSTIIHRGDRVGIVGPNGAGKTTLVNLITGKTAADTGTIRLGINLDVLVIDQKRAALDPSWTLRDALTDKAGDQVTIGETVKHVMSYMKDFLFLPEQAGTPVNVLSGGERGRLMLARGLRTPSNLLVLDEPTNDLDLETLDLLQEFISSYQGTVILVSHDRDFLDRICTSVIASDGDGIWHEYAGGYSDMVAQKGSGVTARKQQKQPQVREASKGAAAPASPANKGKSKLSFKQK